MPPGAGTSPCPLGEDAIDLAAYAGLDLDPWQQWLLGEAMRTGGNGKWLAFEIGMMISRQNGKSAIIEARQLAGLFLLNEPLQLYTAHEFKASSEIFLRIRGLVDSAPDLRKRVRRVITSHGEEGIELAPRPTVISSSSATGVRRSVEPPRLRFLARSRTSARGFSAYVLYWDEAMILGNAVVAAAMPTLSGIPNPQLWYSGSAGGPESTQFGRVRQRGIRGGDRTLAWFEWSADPHTEYCEYNCTLHDDPHDRRSWAKANPALGFRISPEHVAAEHASMDPEVFGRERLGVGQWPVDENGWAVIAEHDWAGCADPDSARPRSPVAIAVDAAPGQTAAAISIAGVRPDGKMVTEIPEGMHRLGVAWVVPQLVRMATEHRPCVIIIDPHGPAAPLIDEAEQARLEITKPTATEIAQAFGLFIVTVGDRQLVHLGERQQPGLWKAVAGAAQREIGDGGRAWARKATSADISPVIAATLAVWGHNKYGHRAYNPLNSVH